MCLSMESVLTMARCTWVRLSSGAVCPFGQVRSCAAFHVRPGTLHIRYVSLASLALYILRKKPSKCFLSPIVQGAAVPVHCFDGALSRMTMQGSVQL